MHVMDLINKVCHDVSILINIDNKPKLINYIHISNFVNYESFTP